VSLALNWQDALAQVKRWKAEDKRIVFTNGCFDLLHPGHIDYLKKSATYGDKLIIGLNDDDSIRRLKGDSRPINPLHDRACMLSALRVVDLVIPFSEDTPINLITALMPNTLIKGGDYQPDDIVGAREVRHHGGNVLVIPFLKGYSSSRLIKRIADSDIY